MSTAAASALTSLLLGLGRKLFQGHLDRLIAMAASALGILTVVALFGGWRRPSDVLLSFLSLVGVETVGGISPQAELVGLHLSMAGNRTLVAGLLLLALIAVTYVTSVWLTTSWDRELVALSRESLDEDPEGTGWEKKLLEFTRDRHGRIIKCSLVWTISTALVVEVVGLPTSAPQSRERVLHLLVFLAAVAVLLLVTTVTARLARGPGGRYHGVVWVWFGLGVQVMAFHLLFTLMVVCALPLLLYSKITGPMMSIVRAPSVPS